ncbi:protein FAM117B-like [Schistocerca gregaria]|uniref:protein FAM117B-like n=1 Tax=Schistocerca gregaria TaxID=7010 RepID=UPI00211EF886|nr:protein FAM117B-like [Schistocerca gregaria]
MIQEAEVSIRSFRSFRNGRKRVGAGGKSATGSAGGGPAMLRRPLSAASAGWGLAWGRRWPVRAAAKAAAAHTRAEHGRNGGAFPAAGDAFNVVGGGAVGGAGGGLRGAGDADRSPAGMSQVAQLHYKLAGSAGRAGAVALPAPATTKTTPWRPLSIRRAGRRAPPPPPPPPPPPSAGSPGSGFTELSCAARPNTPQVFAHQVTCCLLITSAQRGRDRLERRRRQRRCCAVDVCALRYPPPPGASRAPPYLCGSWNHDSVPPVSV